MLTKDQNKALLTVGKAASQNQDWAAYAAFCFAREKGLRKEAFAHLENFLQQAAKWTTEQKIAFVRFLFPLIETVEAADQGPFPHPLSERLAKPTLEAWCGEEKKDSRPFRWYGTYYRSQEHILKAIELDPGDDRAHLRLISWWMDAIYYSLHHLPESYIGEPAEDLRLADAIQSHIDRLIDSTVRKNLTNNLSADRSLIQNYIDWEAAGHANFEQWGKEQGKKVSYSSFGTYSFKN